MTAMLLKEIQRKMTTYYNNDVATTVSVSMQGSGASEYHAIIRSTAPGEPFDVQLATVTAAYEHLRETWRAGGACSSVIS